MQPVVRENNGEVTVVDEAVKQTGSNEKILVDGEDPSVLAEERESSRGSANGEGTQDVSVEGIASEIPRIQLAQATEEDKSLEHMRKLATLEKERYHYQDGILFRTRLDVYGQPKQQICLQAQMLATSPRQLWPSGYKQDGPADTTLLSLAHNNKRLPSTHT